MTAIAAALFVPSASVLFGMLVGFYLGRKWQKIIHFVKRK